MLGLPDGVAAALFDLDGVLTDTATVHAEAWAETFDELPRPPRREHGGAGSGRSAAGTTWPTSTASRGPTASATSWPPWHRAARGRARRPARARHRARARQPQEPLPARAHRAGPGRASSTARCAIWRPRAAPGCAAPSCRRAPTPARCSRSPGSPRSSRHASTGVTIQHRRPARQAGTGRVPRGGPSARRRPGRRPRFSRTRWPASRPAGRAASASSSASTAPTRATRCWPTAPTSSSPTWPTCCPRGGSGMSDAGSFPRRAVGGPGDPARPRPAGP